MADFLFAIATLTLATIALGLLAIARRPDTVERIMAVQLLGTGGSAILLMIAVATTTPAIIDVALMLALLAAFAAVAFVGASTDQSPNDSTNKATADGPRA